MNTVLKIGLCLLFTGCLLNFTSCKKKTEPTPTQVPVQATKQQVPAPAQTSTTEPSAAVKTGDELKKALASQLSAGALEAVSLEDIKAEVAKAGVDQLKAKALEYKKAIAAKKTELVEATSKLTAIPIAQQLGAEAKSLQSNIAALNKTVSNLTERYKIYYDKIKEIGGSVAGLEL